MQLPGAWEGRVRIGGADRRRAEWSGRPAGLPGRRGRRFCPRPVGVGMTAVQAAHAFKRRAAEWAVRRSLTANSVTGISLALGLCAAAWFTTGTRTGDVRGVL